MAINVSKSPKVPYAATPIFMRMREEHARGIFAE
jgi:hypothetical protein